MFSQVLKKYNRAKHSAGASISVANTNNVQKQIKNEEEDVILKERINNYRYGGQIHEFKTEEKETGKEERKIDFATFKEMTENKKSI